VSDLGLRIPQLAFPTVKGVGLKVQDSRLRVEGLGLRVEGGGLRVEG
jgi:hypothetical protein